jgi:hypothetical protein
VCMKVVGCIDLCLRGIVLTPIVHWQAVLHGVNIDSKLNYPR